MPYNITERGCKMEIILCKNGDAPKLLVKFM